MNPTPFFYTSLLLMLISFLDTPVRVGWIVLTVAGLCLLADVGIRVVRRQDTKR